jgi:hypothetical protein
MEDRYFIAIKAHKNVMPTHDEVLDAVRNTLAELVRKNIEPVEALAKSQTMREAVSTFTVEVETDLYSSKK